MRTRNPAKGSRLCLYMHALCGMIHGTFLSCVLQPGLLSVQQSSSRPSHTGGLFWFGHSLSFACHHVPVWQKKKRFSDNSVYCRYPTNKYSNDRIQHLFVDWRRGNTPRRPDGPAKTWASKEGGERGGDDGPSTIHTEGVFLGNILCIIRRIYRKY